MENIVSDSYPWPSLVFISDGKLENQVFCDVVSDPKTRGFMKSIPGSINNRSLLMSTNINGWFLIKLEGDAGLEDSEPSNNMCLWNAVTLHSIDLPPMMSKYCIDNILLTKSIDDHNCVVLLLLDDHLGILYCYINRDDSWTFRDYQKELIEFRGGEEFEGDRFYLPFAFDDNIFMISHSDVVAKIETMEPKSLVIRPDVNFRGPHSHVVGPCYMIDHWVTFCGELFVINVSYSGMNTHKHSFELYQIVSIDIFKLDLSDMLWRIMDNCPNASFFITGEQCLACPVSSLDSSKIGNNVYIVEYDYDNSSKDVYDDHEEEERRLLLHTYHIQQKTITTSSIVTPKDKTSKPYWMLVPGVQALVNDEDDYCNRGFVEKDQLFSKRGNNEVMTVRKHYENKAKKISFRLNDLPPEILKDIFSHLINPSNYFNFRATSRSCRELGTAKEWVDITTYHSNTSSITPSPWLIFPDFQQVGKCVLSMVDPVSRNKYYVTKNETLKGNSRICCSANGWLLLSDPEFEDNKIEWLNLVLYNPITKSTVCLPKIPKDAKHFFFYATPNYPDHFFVIGISVDEPEANYYITEHQPDEDIPNTYKSAQRWEWTKADEMLKEYDNDKFFVRQANVDATCIRGVYYFLVGDGNIAYFSTKGDYTLRIHTLDIPCSRSSYEQCFLAECDFDLLSIYVGREWKWLRAFKFNESDMVWDEVKEVKNNNNLYLSYASSTRSKPESPDVGNRIYFSRFYQDSIVYYSFNTEKFHLSDGKDTILSDYHGTKEQMYSCWLKPSWELYE